MAEPMDFPQADSTWTGSGDVGNLRTCSSPDTTENISCWQLSEEERAEVLVTGIVWLHVWGKHPAVFVSGVSPFIATEV